MGGRLVSNHKFVACYSRFVKTHKAATPDWMEGIDNTPKRHWPSQCIFLCERNPHELQIRRRRRPEGLLSRSRQSQEPGDGAPPWIPIVLTYVSQPDGEAGGQVLPGRAGLPRLRQYRCSLSGQVLLHLRQTIRG